MTDPKLVKPSQPSEPADGSDETSPQEIMTRVMLGLALWGLLLGIGATMFGVGENGGIQLGFRPVRGLIVWACVGGFLGFWGLLLRGKRE